MELVVKSGPIGFFFSVVRMIDGYITVLGNSSEFFWRAFPV